MSNSGPLVTQPSQELPEEQKAKTAEAFKIFDLGKGYVLPTAMNQQVSDQLSYFWRSTDKRILFNVAVIILSLGTCICIRCQRI
jgi:hypothetical protein